MELPQDAHAALTRPACSHINIGTGVDCTIKELAQTMVSVVGFEGELIFDADKPDGVPRKLLDVAKLRASGWGASIVLKDGLEDLYTWFLLNQAQFRA